ncbi:hypothetical protein G7067_08990 [Leucobacter insecticola]|uniref:DUF7822 domain-containing protein n=1 Tax=Leucobacter insecticola TaxID=2714934 RepID=A0A6G8FJG6_9MICO|nr:hypothetical protein [Leucobacter insecticola]QIM16517.1 hypothetical protein G7067_08990 [Leucobacter insecticola]
MANRSYLYIIDRLPEEGEPLPLVRGVHENNYDVPLLHTLLVSGDPVEYPSLIGSSDPEDGWPPARCIVGNARQGIENLEQAFAALPNTSQVQEQIERARAALAAAINHGSYFVLEHAEITHDFAEDAAEAQLNSDRSYASAQHPDLSDLQQNAESLADEVTGASGFWSEHLYYTSVGTVPEPESAVAPSSEEQPEVPAQLPQSQPNPQSQPKKKLSLGARIGIIVGSVVVGIPLLLIVALKVYGAVSAPSGTVSDAAAITAVESYFDALAAGDVERALEHTGVDLTDPLLSQAVLDRSLELAPITNVAVKISDSGEGASGGNKMVEATFMLGDVTASKEFEVSGFDEEVWHIADATTLLISVDSRIAKLGGVSVNGVKVSDLEFVHLLPGAYEIALDTPYYELVGETEFIIANSEDAQILEDIEMELTQTAIDSFRSLVSVSLTECLASKEASSPCGIDIPTTLDSGETVVAGTVTRTLTPEGQSELDTMVPEQVLTDPLLLSTSAHFATKITASFVQDGQTVEGEVVWGFGNTASDFGNTDKKNAKAPTVDFSAATPVVTWG